ncbi:MAG: electron transfer flavoprotein subunit alpha/FixB family protein [Elusimicrobia bacterium]|nr:electron transfer flavoprotein subunit alpha/FixB family protein [Elusimicrobiota bacterium]
MEQEKSAAQANAHKGVWIFAEQRHGQLISTAYELLNVGRRLASDLNAELSAVLIGHKVAEHAQALIEHGADRVFVHDHPMLENFLEEVYSRLLCELIQKAPPDKFLLPASILGRSVAARTAVEARTGLAADCTELSIRKDSGLLNAVRPAFGGNLLATILCENSRPEMATVRPMAFGRAQRVAGRQGEVVVVKVEPERFKTRTRFVQFVREDSGEQDIASCDKVVSGGRGLGASKGFDLIREFAHTLGAAVGASRATVDAGWIPYRHQVGLTGRTVRPKLYFACGISGQIQHLAGMSSSEVIVAINTDPEAPMMKLATFSIEGDLYEVVPAIIGELKHRRGDAVTHNSTNSN